MYITINFINIDYIIAYRNIKRYYETNDIDIYYLMNNHTDNIPLLIDLYNKTDDENIKEDLKEYLNSIETKTNGFQEFNISKKIANKIINSEKIQ